MEHTIEVLFTPAEFAMLPKRDLRDTFCIVFDVLRATSSMITALAHGAAAITPVAEISEAIACRTEDPEVLLAGERDGLKIGPNLTGSIPFDLGNSPREFTSQKVGGRKIVMTTTNGTRALRACSGAKAVLIASFLNLAATANYLRQQMPNQLLLVCSGTFEEAALEDILAAGALLDWLGRDFDTYRSADSVLVARTLYQQSQGNTPFSRQERARASTPGAKPRIPPMNAPAGTPPSPPLEEAAGPRTPFMVGETAAFDLLEAISRSRNARRLLSHPDLKDDVAFCAQRDLFDLVATMDRDGCVTRP